MGRVGIRRAWAAPASTRSFRREVRRDLDSPPTAAASSVSGAWRPGRLVAIATGITLLLLGSLGYVLAHSQAVSRREARQRFQAQATIAAGLTEAIFSTIDAAEAQAAHRAFGTARIDPRGLAALVGGSHLAYAGIAGPTGQILAAIPGSLAPVEPHSADLTVAVQHAAEGTPWFSDLFLGPGGRFMTAQAVPFATASGRRIEVLVYPAEEFYSFLSHYLQGAVPGRKASAFVLDRAGRLIGSSLPGATVGHLTGRPLRAGAAEGPSPPITAGRPTPFRAAGAAVPGVVVTAPIKGTDWSVAISEPATALYPADVGSERWLTWLVYGAFGLAMLGCVYLLRQTLHGAARLVSQARYVDAVNTDLRASNEELRAFSYSVSHDLRAPLRAIDGFSRIVLDDHDGLLTATQERYLGLVCENTQVMGALIDDLLALSRLVNQPLRREPVSTSELVSEVERDLLADVGDRHVTFVNGSLPVVEADPGLLRQVFVNLLDNAVKYTRDTADAKITVDSEYRDGVLVFSVSDNGAGFDMRYADKLFEVFQRLHRAEDYEGTGVGLAVVQRIVKRHGGRAWGEGTVGHGATFYFTLERREHESSID